MYAFKSLFFFMFHFLLFNSTQVLVRVKAASIHPVDYKLPMLMGNLPAPFTWRYFIFSLLVNDNVVGLDFSGALNE